MFPVKGYSVPVGIDVEPARLPITSIIIFLASTTGGY